MDIIQIDAAYVFAGDSKFRLGSRKDKGQAPILSFTQNPASDLAFMHLDGEFSYSRTGYYPEANSLELFLGARGAKMLCALLKNVVAHTAHPGESPQVPPWPHGPESPRPVIVEEYMVKTKAIVVTHPLDLVLRPRTADGFATFVALTRPRREGDEDIGIRLKFWLTERSIPALNLLQRRFRQDYGHRVQPMHVTFSFNGDELSLLQRQLEVLQERHGQERP